MNEESYNQLKTHIEKHWKRPFSGANYIWCNGIICFECFCYHNRGINVSTEFSDVGPFGTEKTFKFSDYETFEDLKKDVCEYVRSKNNK